VNAGVDVVQLPALGPHVGVLIGVLSVLGWRVATVEFAGVFVIRVRVALAAVTAQMGWRCVHGFLSGNPATARGYDQERRLRLDSGPVVA
jgi:hypothetical protein